MKKHLLIAALFTASCLLPPLSASAAEETLIADGLAYTVIGDDCYLSGVDDPSISSVFIPAEIDGRKVMVSENVFKDCQNLKEIIADENQSSVYTIDGVLFQKEADWLLAYPCAKQGAEYRIPDGITGISGGAFYGCAELENVIFPENLTTSEAGIFYNCPKLSVIDGTISGAGSLALHDCKNISSLHFGGINTDISLAVFPELQEVAFEDDTEIRGSFKASKNEKLTTVSVPYISTISEIDPDAIDYALTHSTEGKKPTVEIADCENLEVLYLRYDSMHGRVRIKNCPKLEKIIISDIDTAEIGEQYTYDSTLELVNLPALKTVICNAQTIRTYLTCYQCDNVTVYGRTSDNVLHEKCITDNIPYYTDGDIDGNGAIELLDVITLNKNLLGLQQLDESQQKAADVNADDSLDSSDSLLILRYIVHLEDKLG